MWYKNDNSNSKIKSSSHSRDLEGLLGKCRAARSMTNFCIYIYSSLLVENKAWREMNDSGFYSLNHLNRQSHWSLEAITAGPQKLCFHYYLSDRSFHFHSLWILHSTWKSQRNPVFLFWVSPFMCWTRHLAVTWTAQALPRAARGPAGGAPGTPGTQAPVQRQFQRIFNYDCKDQN